MKKTNYKLMLGLSIGAVVIAVLAVFCEWCVMKRIKEGRIDPELVKKLETVRAVSLCE